MTRALEALKAELADSAGGARADRTAKPRQAICEAAIACCESRPPRSLSFEWDGVDYLALTAFIIQLTGFGRRERERTRGRAIHARRGASVSGGELLPLMKRALEAYRRELQKRRLGVGATTRDARKMHGGVLLDADSSERRTKRSRYVPAAVARAVYVRDGGCCTFRSGDGRRCGARRFLELDHSEPWAEGGESTVENLRLRCRAHNQHAARAHFGGDRISAAVEHARNRA